MGKKLTGLLLELSCVWPRSGRVSLWLEEQLICAGSIKPYPAGASAPLDFVLIVNRVEIYRATDRWMIIKLIDGNMPIYPLKKLFLRLNEAHT